MIRSVKSEFTWKINKARTFLKNVKNNKSRVSDVANDIWIDIFCLLDLHDFYSIRETCKLFHSLTQANDSRINNYWEMQCKAVCSDIELNYHANDWNLFFDHLKSFLLSVGSIEIDADNHKIYNPHSEILPISLQIDKNDDIWYKACSSDNLLIYQMLVSPNNSKNYSINFRYQYKWPNQSTVTALHLCCQNEHSWQIIKYLLSFDDIDLDLDKINGSCTALTTAVTSNNTKAVQMLLNHPNIKKTVFLDENTDVCDGYNLLHIACKKGNFEMVKILIENGANINATSGNNDNRTTALHLCCQNENSLQILEYLLSFAEIDLSVKKTDEYYSALIAAINSNNMKAVRMLVKHPNMTKSILDDTNNSVSQVSGYTALHFACKHGNLEMVKILVENGANINIKSVDAAFLQQTPLHVACYYKRTKCVEFLVKSHANVYLKDSGGKNALHYACSSLIMYEADTVDAFEISQTLVRRFDSEHNRIVTDRDFLLEIDNDGLNALMLASKKWT